jgi:hypothetical protein
VSQSDYPRSKERAATVREQTRCLTEGQTSHREETTSSPTGRLENPTGRQRSPKGSHQCHRAYIFSHRENPAEKYTTDQSEPQILPQAGEMRARAKSAHIPNKLDFERRATRRRPGHRPELTNIFSPAFTLLQHQAQWLTLGSPKGRKQYIMPQPCYIMAEGL